MTLDKWAVNDMSLLPTTSSTTAECVIGDRDLVSILGLRWYARSDSFDYKVQAAPDPPVSTKRGVLSEVAKLYDPLGWLTPVIVKAKILLQELWISGHDWDATVGKKTQADWTELRSQLVLLEKLRLPHRIIRSAASKWELHGFSDASEKAYAAAVFLVTTDAVLGTQSTLLVAKLKVAPIKTVSLPRLELCGALLHSRLIVKVREDLQNPECPVYCSTDSQVVLAWLRDPRDSVETVIHRSSSWRRVLRTVAVILRWRALVSSPRTRLPSELQAAEIERAKVAVLRAVQTEHFPQDLQHHQEGKALAKDSHLRRFRPFLDDEGLMRVGGCLHYSFLSFAERYPLIIPKSSHIAELLIRDAHRVTFHGGPQLMLSHLLRTFWIIHAKNRVRQVVRRCVTCTGYRGQTLEQQMAPLPSVRLAPSRSFTLSGVDYAGPFAVRTSKGRGQRSSKGYVAIFVCMVTRAVHIEVVSDSSAPTFLMAFRRFTSRRGLYREVFSDNGTTFQGADSELRRLFQEASSFSQEVASALTCDGISWSFIPPRAPHFGGIWEAAVKCFKHHLRRVAGEATVTYEEFSTLGAQIEACLNSRPLRPLSSDVNDPSALTPGHFLVGTALTAPPKPFLDFSVTGLRRWQMVSNMFNHFWRRWRKAVLHHLQVSAKWFCAKRDLRVGDLVLLKDDLQPPQKWSLARILQLHPGPDGLTRVLTLKTTSSTLTRPLAKIVPLPTNSPPSTVTGEPAAAPAGGSG